MNRFEFLMMKVSEECNEIGQRASKAAQFGIDEIQDGQNLTNEERLINEFDDLLVIFEILMEEGFINRDIYSKYSENDELFVKKLQKIEKYYNYSKKLGNIND